MSAFDVWDKMEKELSEAKAEIERLQAHNAMACEFEQGQWWIAELDSMSGKHNLSDDEKRAIAVIHNLLRTLHSSPESTQQWLSDKLAQARKDALLEAADWSENCGERLADSTFSGLAKQFEKMAGDSSEWYSS